MRGTLLRVAPKPAVEIGVVVGPTEMKPFPPPLTLVSSASLRISLSVVLFVSSLFLFIISSLFLVVATCEDGNSALGKTLLTCFVQSPALIGLDHISESVTRSSSGSWSKCRCLPSL